MNPTAATLLALLLAGTASVAATPVSTASLADLQIDAEAQAPASVVSLNAATLSSELTATVADYPLPVRAQVKAGAALVRLDDADYRLALAQSEALLAAATARVELVSGRLDRARRLIADGFVSVDDLAGLEAELAVARADVRVQEAAVAIARRALAKTVIRAPFDGETGHRLAAVGQLALPGTALIDIVELGAIELVAEIPAGDAISLDGAGDLHFESQGRRYPVVLQRLSGIVDRGTRNREARLRFSELSAPIGSQGRLNWRRPGSWVPAHLLVRRDGGLGLFVVEDGRARFISLPDAQEGRPARVDLDPETQVVVDGRDALRDGDPVRLP